MQFLESDLSYIYLVYFSAPRSHTSWTIGILVRVFSFHPILRSGAVFSDMHSRTRFLCDATEWQSTVANSLIVHGRPNHYQIISSNLVI